MTGRALVLAAVALSALAGSAGVAAFRSRDPVPEAAPAVDVVTMDGRRVSLADLRGRPVVVEFFAPWCPECRRDVPRLNDLAARGVNVLAVAGEGGPADIDAFIRETRARYLVAPGDPDLVARYGVVTYPTRFLVGPGGELVARETDFARIVREVGR